MSDNEFHSILELEEIFDDRYVLKSNCSEKQDKVNKMLANDDTRIRLFEQKIKSWEWIFKIIATGTIGTLLTSILSLVFK